MYLHIDPSQVPPAVQLFEADDFRGFKVVIEVPTHAWIEPDALADFARREDDEEWRQRLAAMLEFAANLGWLDETGRIRAHVEVQSSVQENR